MGTEDPGAHPSATGTSDNAQGQWFAQNIVAAKMPDRPLHSPAVHHHRATVARFFSN
jgi:hypothetical protein